MKRTCAVALVGQKFMGRAHANAWSQANRFFDLPVAARAEIVAGRDAAALREFARRFGFARSTTDWREIPDDPAVDLVDLATPNDLHAEQAIAMLEAGKHVACEKPLAATFDEARAMWSAAAGARRARTFVWFNYRRVPALALAWKLVRAGKLGRIFHVRATYLQSWGGKDTPMSWRFQRKHAGSGAHGDLNAHMVDLARFLTGDEIVEIHGAVERSFIEERSKGARRGSPRRDVDDCTLFLATLAGGATASFEATRLASGHHNDHAIEINGERGSLRFSFEDMNALSFCDATEKRVTQGWRRIVATAPGVHPYVEGWWPEGHGLGYEHTFVNMAADILRVLGGQKPEVPLPDFEDAFLTQRVLQAAMISAREGQAVKLGDVK